ncbi:MAG TPA: phosphoethanolamine methyltransferase [Rhodospirillaceae bacterium]|nr:phosphoethanolamine methyltransferase [Rhodospirillaceae bacterium]
MSNPLEKILANPTMQARLLRLKVMLVGLAIDFWKDTPFSQMGRRTSSGTVAASSPSSGNTQKAEDKTNSDSRKPWFADRIQVVEKMWGEGNVFPGGENYLDDLIVPLGLNKEMSVLDLNAGLGGFARKITSETGAYVTGLETNQVLASRGMVMSIAAGKGKQASVEAYDPDAYKAERQYDCVFVREFFYRIIGKEKFFKAVANSVKAGGGQLVFMDYILEDRDKENPAIKKWLEAEKKVTPLPFIDMVKEWKKLGFDMRVAEDQTTLYRSEILKGLASFVEFLALNVPGPDTKPSIVREIDLWARRVAALENGLRYCRFYGIKH